MKYLLLFLLFVGCAKEKVHTITYEGFSWDQNGQTYYRNTDNNLVTDGRRADKVNIKVTQGFEAYIVANSRSGLYPASVRIYLDGKLVSKDSTSNGKQSASVTFVIP